METGEDDPRRPLLGGAETNHQSHTSSIVRKTVRKLCSTQSWKRRLPISIWLPNYSWAYMLQDFIAGLTVGLTSIPQGIAYAIIAGVPPQVGLYSSIFPGLVYLLFGSCKDVIVGPTAILAALVAKYVAYSVDFAYLAAFLSGCVILLLGVLQLGFLLDFISKPVISGFTTAAAFQIAASQLKSLFRISGKSGSTFIDAVINFFQHIKTVKLWDPVLGFITIVVLVLLKKATMKPAANGETVSTCRAFAVATWKYVVSARNAIVVFAGAAVAFILHRNGLVPFALTGEITGGLPNFGPPPFNTVVKNQTYNFEQMLSVFGPEGLVMPLVAILESIAIAKAFAGSTSVDSTQEMITLGLCNVFSSFCQCMPTTGSFTRTALNNASGVVTPASSLFKALVVLLAVTLMTEAFYFIPRATLAAIIMVAMLNIMDLSIIRRLWKNSKLELCVYAITVVVGLTAGLEYGILLGVCSDLVRVMFKAARPQINVMRFKVGNQDSLSIELIGNLSYSCAEYLVSKIKRNIGTNSVCVVLDGKHLHSVDIGVAENLITVVQDLEKSRHRILFWNFPPGMQKLFTDLQPDLISKFVAGHSIDQYVLNVNTELSAL